MTLRGVTTAFAVAAAAAAVAFGVLLAWRAHVPAVPPHDAAGHDAYLDTPQTRGKISPASGDYETFAGVTLIAPVADRLTNPGWAAVHDLLARDPVLRACYTPLPVTSYHMTVHPLATVSSVPGSTPRAFDAVLARWQPALAALANETTAQPFAPAGTLAGVHAGGIVVLAVDLAPADAAAARALRARVAALTGLPALDGYRQHITLAYRHAAPAPGDRARLRAALARLETVLRREVLARAGGRLRFAPAQLMLFHDMTRFVPTDPARWGAEPLADLAPTPPALRLKHKPAGWSPPWPTAAAGAEILRKYSGGDGDSDGDSNGESGGDSSEL